MDSAQQVLSPKQPHQANHALLPILLSFVVILLIGVVVFALYTNSSTNYQSSSLPSQTVSYATPSPTYENPFNTPSPSYENPFEQVAPTPESLDSTYQNPFVGL